MKQVCLCLYHVPVNMLGDFCSGAVLQDTVAFSLVVYLTLCLSYQENTLGIFLGQLPWGQSLFSDSLKGYPQEKQARAPGKEDGAGGEIQQTWFQEKFCLFVCFYF